MNKVTCRIILVHTIITVVEAEVKAEAEKETKEEEA